jgi:hypothetical protein
MTPTVNDLPDADPAADPAGADVLELGEAEVAELAEVVAVDDGFEDELQAAAPTTSSVAATTNSALPIFEERFIEPPLGSWAPKAPYDAPL